MTVYVDDMRTPFGRMKMSHMIADDHDELLAMADRIGVARRWLQHEGTYKEHFDVCESKRLLAIELGAQAVSQRDLGLLLRRRRKAMTCQGGDCKMNKTFPGEVIHVCELCGVGVCAWCLTHCNPSHVCETTTEHGTCKAAIVSRGA